MAPETDAVNAILRVIDAPKAIEGAPDTIWHRAEHVIGWGKYLHIVGGLDLMQLAFAKIAEHEKAQPFLGEISVLWDCIGEWKNGVFGGVRGRR